MNLAPFVADLVEDVFTRSKLIQFLNDDGSVDIYLCASRESLKTHGCGRTAISKSKNVIGSYRDYALTIILLSASARTIDCARNLNPIQE